MTENKKGPGELGSFIPSEFRCKQTQDGECDTHGKFTAVVIAGHAPRCPRCTEEMLRAEGVSHAAEVKNAVDIALRLEKLAEAGVPERYRDKGFDNFIAETDEQKKALEALRSYAENFPFARERGTSRILAGLNGTGKSHLAAAVVESVLRQGYSALYISSLAALSMVSDCYGKHSKMTQGEAYNILTEPDLLCIDDVGTANENDTTIQITYEIIYRRYDNNRPTIITTNDTVEELEKLIGTRTLDRLRENGGKLIQFNWVSVRGSIE